MSPTETASKHRECEFVEVSLAFEDWRAKALEDFAQANLLRADLNYLLAKGEIGCGDRCSSEVG